MAIVIKTLSDSAQARKDLSDLRQSVEGIKRSSEGLADRFASLGKGLAIGAVAASSAIAFTRLSDSITNFKNRITSITDTAAQATRAIRNIGTVAAETRTSLDATTKLYTKMSMSAKDLGASQSQIVNVTRAINQGFKISGATAEEGAAAITQLSQAFASGKLAGDEFNSVMENAPFLAQQITKGMGITLGQLYKLRDEGKLFARDVFGAILKQMGAIDSKFQKVQVTYSDAFTNLGTAFKLLTMAAFDAFAGSGGGIATMINGWAVGIIQFAQNFAFHLLKAQTIAIGFVIDVTEFFKDLWKAIVEGGPEVIVQLFQDLYNGAIDLVKRIGPIAQQISAIFVSYAGAFYRGASSTFFAFIAWLQKSERTSGIASILLKVNAAVLEQANALASLLARIDFSSLLVKAESVIKTVWDRLKAFDFQALWSMLVSSFKSGFNRLSKIDVMGFFPKLDVALAVIKKWAQTAAHWFWWLYDVTIGHSYIPDLVLGIIAWFGKLLGAPFSAAKKFASLVAGAFKAINPFKTWTKALTLMTAAMAGFFAYVNKQKVFELFGATTTSKSKVTGVERINAPMYSLDDVVPKSSTQVTHSKPQDLVFRTLNKIDDFFNGAFKTTTQNPMSGKVETTQHASRARFFDKLHIPREDQAKIAFGLTAIVTSALHLVMSSGSLRSVVISLFTSAALLGIARGIDTKTLHKFFAEGAATFVSFVGKGFETILGTSISKDPFGFLLLIAKTSLLFKAGRDYFLGLAKDIAIAPTKIGIGAANLGGLGLLNTQIKIAGRNFTANMTKFNQGIALETRNVDQAIHNLATQLNISTAEARRMVDMNSTRTSLPTGPLKDAVDSRRRAENLSTQRDAYSAAQTEKADLAKEKVKELTETLAEKGKALKEGVKDFGGGVGGTMGAGYGLEWSQQKIASLEAGRKAQATTALQNSGATIGGKKLNAEQAGKVVSGEIEIKDLDKAGQEVAENIRKGMEVPAFQKIFIDAAGVMGGQLIGSLLGATLASGVIGAAQMATMWTVEKFRAGAQRVAAFVGMLWFRAQYFAVAIAGAAIQSAAARVGAIAGAIAANVVTFAGWVAAGIAGGEAGAVAMMIGMALLPVLLVAAVVGAAYLIVKHWDTIKEVGKQFVALLISAWNDPINFLTKKLPAIISSLFDKVREWLPSWLGGKNTNEPPPEPKPSGDVLRKASGGYISGPGSGRSDSIPALLSNGEYVVNAKATSQNRSLLEAINSGTGVQHFANGGIASYGAQDPTLRKLRAERNALFIKHRQLKAAWPLMSTLGRVMARPRMDLMSMRLTYLNEAIYLRTKKLAPWLLRNGLEPLPENAQRDPRTTGNALDKRYGIKKRRAVEEPVDYSQLRVEDQRKRRYATGGHVRGPGGPRADSIMAMLSNGEFVVNAASAKRNRGLLERINSGGVQKFANGGIASYGGSDPVLQRLYKEKQRKRVEMDKFYDADYYDADKGAALEAAMERLDAAIATRLRTLKINVSLLKDAPAARAMNARTEGARLDKAHNVTPGRRGRTDFNTYADLRIEDQRPRKPRNWFQRMLGYASGGNVQGPGGPRSDAIMAMLSNGEFVVNAASAKRNRGLLERINGGEVPGFADGGYVSAYDSMRGEAMSQRNDAMRSANKASVGWQKASALELVARWDNYLATLDTAESSFTGPGGSPETSDEKRKRRERTAATPRSTEGAGLKFSDELERINTIFPDVNLSMEEYLSMTAEARKRLLDLTLPVARLKSLAEDMPAGSPEAFETAQKANTLATERSAEALSITSAARTPYKGLAGRLEKADVSLTEEQFQLLTPSTVKALTAYLIKQEEWAKQLQDVTISPERARQIRIDMNTSKAALDSMLSRDQVLATPSKLDDFELAGMEVGKDSYNRLTNAAQKRLAQIADEIIRLQQVVEASADDEAARLAAIARIDALKKEAGTLTTKREDKIKQAGEDFAATMKESFAGGIVKFFKTGKFPLLDIMETFVDKLLNNFVNSLADAFMGKDSKIGGFFDKLGQSSVGGGGIANFLGLGQQMLSQSAPKQDSAGSTIGGIFSGIGSMAKSFTKVGTGISAPILDSAPSIGTGIAGMLQQSAGGIGKEMGTSLSSVLGGAGGAGGGMTGLASMAGSLVGLLIGSLFADGGPVNGPGTSTSDSIPARLSNGEYVINARSTSKFRPVLDAINNGQVPMFAEGGLVGEMIPATSSIASAVNPVVNSRQTNTTNNFNVTGDITRQTRREVLNLMPQIAAGVNGYNREKGYR